MNSKRCSKASKKQRRAVRGKTGVGCNLMTRIDYFSAKNSILILQIIGKVWPLESAAQVFFFLLFSCGVF